MWDMRQGIDVLCSPTQSWANDHWTLLRKWNPLFHLQLEYLSRELPVVVTEKCFKAGLKSKFFFPFPVAQCQMIEMLLRLFQWMEPLCVICWKINTNIGGFHQPGSQTSRPISYSWLVSESLAKLFINQPIVTMCLIRASLSENCSKISKPAENQMTLQFKKEDTEYGIIRLSHDSSRTHELPHG